MSTLPPSTSSTPMPAPAALLAIHFDDSSKRLKISFPSRLVSTNTDRARAQLETYWRSVEARLSKWTALELDFGATTFIDSIGLNFLFDIVKVATERNAPIIAWVRLRTIRLTLYTVRLDRRMDIRLMEVA